LIADKQGFLKAISSPPSSPSFAKNAEKIKETWRAWQIWHLPRHRPLGRCGDKTALTYKKAAGIVLENPPKKSLYLQTRDGIILPARVET
jgi:hypothetical protein